MIVIEFEAMPKERRKLEQEIAMKAFEALDPFQRRGCNNLRLEEVQRGLLEAHYYYEYDDSQDYYMDIEAAMFGSKEGMKEPGCHCIDCTHYRENVEF